MRRLLRRDGLGDSGGEDQMVTEVTQYTIPLVSALIGAIIGSILTYKINLHLEAEKRKYQVYTQLNGKSKAFKQIHHSLIYERVLAEYFSVINERSCRHIFDDEYKRHLELSDKYKVEFFYYYANIIELLSSVELLFKDSFLVDESIKKIFNAREFNNIEREGLEMFSRVFRIEALRRTENLAGYDIKHLLESTEELLKVASLASECFISQEVLWPLDGLLDYLKEELKK